MSSSKILTYLNIGHFIDHYFLMVFPFVVLAIEPSWDLSYDQALALGTPLYVGFALGTLPVGWLGDTYKREYLLVALFIGTGFSSIGVAIAPNPFWLMAGLGALGLFLSIYHPIGLSMITMLNNRPGKTLAINGVYGNLGLAAASLISATLADLAGWRSAFLVPGIVALMAGGFYCMNLRSGNNTLVTESADKTEIKPRATKATQTVVITVVMIAAIFGGIVFNGVTITLPKLFEIRIVGSGNQLSSVGFYSALVFAIAAFAQLPVGNLLDRFGAKPVLMILLSLQLLTLLMLANATGYSVVALACLLVLLMFAEIPVTGWLVARYISTAWRSRVFSMEYVLSLGMSALMVPTIASLFAQGFSFSHLYSGFAVSAGIILVVVPLLPRYKLSKENPISVAT
jgi:MFS family permease